MGVLNFRPIRSITNTDGKQIRENTIFRSGKLSKLSTKKLKKVKDKYGISSVIDLRSPSELMECPDTQIDEISFYHFPPLNDEQNPAVTAKTRKKILNQIIHKEGGAIKHLEDNYRAMITSQESRDSFRQSILTFLESEDAVLFHCTQGKDRTGVMAMVLLMALGFTKEEIWKDYRLSNRYCRLRNVGAFIAVTIFTMSVRKSVALHQMLTARKEYFDAIFSEIENLFGDVEGFLHDGLGLTDSDLLQLQDKYLCEEN